MAGKFLTKFLSGDATSHKATAKPMTKSLAKPPLTSPLVEKTLTLVNIIQQQAMPTPNTHVMLSIDSYSVGCAKLIKNSYNCNTSQYITINITMP